MNDQQFGNLQCMNNLTFPIQIKFLLRMINPAVCFINMIFPKSAKISVHSCGVSIRTGYAPDEDRVLL